MNDLTARLEALTKGADGVEASIQMMSQAQESLAERIARLETLTTYDAQPRKYRGRWVK